MEDLNGYAKNLLNYLNWVVERNPVKANDSTVKLNYLGSRINERDPGYEIPSLRMDSRSAVSLLLNNF